MIDDYPTWTLGPVRRIDRKAQLAKQRKVERVVLAVLGAMIVIVSLL
jgi:hypothetical protein